MRHRKAGRQLRRTSEQRLALLRNLASSLVEHGALVTTEAKAKELRPFVEKLITKAKTGTLHARRLAERDVPTRRISDKLFHDIGPQFATRAGGYTRILKTGHRKGDGAEMARIELVGATTNGSGGGGGTSAKRAAKSAKGSAAKTAGATRAGAGKTSGAKPSGERGGKKKEEKA
jgi:large subunit ribosomal protein L17